MATYSRKRKRVQSLEHDQSLSPPLLSPPKSSSITRSPWKRKPLGARSHNSSLSYTPDINRHKHLSTSDESALNQRVSHKATKSNRPSALTPKDARSKNNKNNKEARLTQLTIDLGGPVSKQCPHPRCGMHYIPSNVQDAALHRRHHISVVGCDLSNGGTRKGGFVSDGMAVPKTLLRDASVKVVPYKRRKRKNGEQQRVREKEWMDVLGNRRRREQDDLVEADDMILTVTRNSSASARRFAMNVLEAAEEELGAFRTPAVEVWAPVRIEQCNARTSMSLPEAESKYKKLERAEYSTSGKNDHLPTPPCSSPPPTATMRPRSAPEPAATIGKAILDNKHAIHLYVSTPMNNCIGMLLTERIRSARSVVTKIPRASTSISSTTSERTLLQEAKASNDIDIDDSPLDLSETRSKAYIGISRVYISADHRGKGIGVALLNSLFDSQDEKTIEERVGKTRKEDVAFSAPTTLGRRLAAAWCARHGIGVRIYDHDDTLDRM